MNPVTTALRVHTGTCLIYTQPQSPANFLPFCCIAVGMFQCADLEHIRVIPALPQGGMGENKPGGLLKAEQPLLILQDQVIGRYII